MSFIKPQTPVLIVFFAVSDEDSSQPKAQSCQKAEKLRDGNVLGDLTRTASRRELLGFEYIIPLCYVFSLSIFLSFLFI